MNTKRVEWKCPSCQAAFSLPAGVAQPSVCPQCDADLSVMAMESTASRQSTSSQGSRPRSQKPVSRSRKQGQSTSRERPRQHPVSIPPLPHDIPELEQDEFVETRSPSFPVVPTPTSADPFDDFEDPPEWSQEPIRKRKEKKAKAAEPSSRYQALRLIATAYRVLAAVAVLVSLFCLFYTIKVVATVAPTDERTASIVSGLIGLGASFFASICFLATSEIIRLFIDIEKNTRQK